MILGQFMRWPWDDFKPKHPNDEKGGDVERRAMELGRERMKMEKIWRRWAMHMVCYS